jgi:hypothetical protein
MTIKLLLLKSGEDVIADVQEMVVEEKVVGYILQYPARAKLVGDTIIRDGKETTPFKLQLTPWMPLSKDNKVPLVADWVVTITEPVDQLTEMYVKGVEDYEIGKSTDPDSGVGEGDSNSD